MTYTFRAGPDRTVLAQLQPVEAQILIQLFGELLDLLAPEPAADGAGPSAPDPLAVELGLDGLGLEPPPAERPQDPALARLFPDAYPDDAPASAEFRRYTESDLKTGKRDRARAALESLGDGSGGRLSLDEQQAMCWLGALNDLRLALGAWFGLADDGQEPGAGLPPDDPMLDLVPTYHYLGYLQELLLEALPR